LPRMLHLGFDTYIPVTEVEFITGMPVSTSSLKRLIEDAKAKGKFVNCTKNKKIRSVVVSKNGYVYYSHVNATTLKARYEEAFYFLQRQANQTDESFA